MMLGIMLLKIQSTVFIFTKNFIQKFILLRNVLTASKPLIE